MMDYDARRLTMSKTAYKQLIAKEYNQKYNDEQIKREVLARKAHEARVERLRRLITATSKGEPCTVNIDASGAIIVPPVEEIEVTCADDRGPIIITGGELGRLWAQEHIERIKSGQYDEIGIVPQKVIDPHWYRRSRW